MKPDQLAFMNQQLAALLRSGVPLEVALRQLCATMKPGLLRRELQLLEADLAQGVALPRAMESRRFPHFYSRLLQAGAAGQDLPGVLQLLSDYYHKIFGLRTRFQALMVYPLLVLLAAVLLSLVLGRFLVQDPVFWGNPTSSTPLYLVKYLPTFFLGTLLLLFLLGLGVPPLRRFLAWKLPGFREVHLSQFAFAMELLLRRGQTVPEALKLLEGLEKGSGAGSALALSRREMERGMGRPEQAMAVSGFFPPLFLWLVGSAGERVEEGFAQAGEIYRDRALYRLELVLYSALPVSVLMLGIMLVIQLFLGMRYLFFGLDGLGS